jgi:hypothetical protein
MHSPIDRRSFLKSAAVLPTLSLLPVGGSVVGASPGPGLVLRPKKPAAVRSAFFYPPPEVVREGRFEDGWRHEKWFTYPGNQFKPGEQQAKFTRKIRAMSTDLDIDLAIDRDPIYTEAGIQAFMADVEQSKPEALLLFNFYNTLSAKLKPVLDAFDGPIIVYHPVGANHQLPPAHFRTAPRVQYIHSIENWAALERGLRCIHAQTRMAQSTMLRISGKYPERMRQTDADFGTTVQCIPADEFNTVFDALTVTPEIKAMARAVRARAQRVTDLSDTAFLDAAKAHVAVQQIMACYEADAITIECLFLKHRKPCLSFAVNNGALIPCGCENHYEGTLTLMLGAGLFGRGGFLHNPEFDTEENRYFATHCTCTTQLHGPEGKATPYRLRPFFHQAPKTLALDVQWPVGERVTMVKVHSGKNSLDAWAGSVISTPESPPTGGCATRVLIEMDDVKDICDIYPGPHPILYCGDFVRQAKTYADLYGLEIRTNG